MRALILGAAGFIGSHLTRRMLNEGHEVVAVDIDASKLQEVRGHQRLNYIDRDIRDRDLDLVELFSDSDVVVDLIAHANPAQYISIPLEVFRLNFTENLRIAETCVAEQKRLIQFSTCEVYGRTPSTLRVPLVHPDDPRCATFSEDQSEFILGPVSKHRWIYASAKQLLERLIHAHGLGSDFEYTIVRPFNFIGPNIDFLPSEKGGGNPRVFSHFLDALLNGSPLHLVDGGTARRCYTYIDDAIECCYRIMVNQDGVCHQQIFNIGSPQNEISIRDLAKLMREIFEESFPELATHRSSIRSIPSSEFYGAGYEDSDRRIPDISKAVKLLGWTPKWSVQELLLETMRQEIQRVGARASAKGPS